MTRADIGKQDIRCRYVGKQAPRASHKRLTAVVVMDGKELMKPESEHNETSKLRYVINSHNTAPLQRPLKLKAYIRWFLLPPVGHWG